jgi:hypothetical protein
VRQYRLDLSYVDSSFHRPLERLRSTGTHF